MKAWGDGYFQQCASPPVRLVADARLNVELVPRAKLSASPDADRSGQLGCIDGGNFL
jgi:hypothetical protein